MSVRPQPSGYNDPTLPQTWPEPSTVPGRPVTLEPSAWAEWTPLPIQGYEIQPMRVAPRSPVGSVLLSIFVPGLGSMVNENVGVGVTILVLNIVGWILAIVLIGIPLALATWIWGMVDAYRSAQRWNRAHRIVG
jgi:TM2 domain-containing membrane protein YozV